MRDLTPLCDLAAKYQTDKGGRHLHAGDTCHEYTPVYWDLLKDRRENVRSVLEIGVNTGASLRTWREFFPNAMITGLDCETGCLFTEDRIRTLYAHQASPASLLAAMQHIPPEDPPFDLIVDDGSHKTDDQIVSMLTLLPFMARDGLYVIEDLIIDHAPWLVGAFVPVEDYTWEAIPCEIGLGKAKCGCGCNGPEQLLVVRHRE
jgi:hypothetical protein